MTNIIIKYAVFGVLLHYWRGILRVTLWTLAIGAIGLIAWYTVQIPFWGPIWVALMIGGWLGLLDNGRR